MFRPQLRLTEDGRNATAEHGLNSRGRNEWKNLAVQMAVKVLSTCNRIRTKLENYVTVNFQLKNKQKTIKSLHEDMMSVTHLCKSIVFLTAG